MKIKLRFLEMRNIGKVCELLSRLSACLPARLKTPSFLSGRARGENCSVRFVLQIDGGILGDFISYHGGAV